MPTRSLFHALEKIMKGPANHRRIETLFVLDKETDLSTEQLVTKMKINYQTGALHIRKLVSAGLVYEHRRGVEMLHRLSPTGSLILVLLKKLK